MFGYIKRKEDFYLIHAATATSWDLPLQSVQAATGTVRLVGAVPQEAAGAWLIFGGAIWTIDRVEPAEGLSTLSVSLGTEAFDRPLIYPAEPPATVGSFILQILRDNFQACPDGAYALPYLSLVNRDSTPLVPPDLSEGGLFTLPDYLRKVSETTRVELSVAASLLTVTIAPASPEEHTVLFGGAVELQQQTFSRSLTSKVTVLQEGVASDFYLGYDGTVSAEPPSPRMAGEWQVVEARAKAVPLETAQGVFAKNVSANKIVFASPERYALGDRIRTRLEGQPTTVEVTTIRLSSGDSRRVYECGELQTTLSARLAASGSIKALGGVSAKGGNVDGNLGVLGQLNAGEGATFGGPVTINAALTAAGRLVLGPESYGPALPTTDLTDGRLFFLLEES